jgi:hypothetical protein
VGVTVSTHSPLPALRRYPASQSEQTMAPAADCCPVAQAEQPSLSNAADPPTVAWYFPTAHSVHAYAKPAADASAESKP